MATPNSISCWGDSITYYGYPAYLQDLMPGSTVSNDGVAGEGSSQIAARMVAATSRYSDVHVFWIGVNDSWSQSNILNALASMVAVLPHSRYLILMPVTGESNYAPPAAPHMANLKSAIEAAYPNNFFDIRGYLLTRGNGGAEDNADISADTVPSSLRVDNIHPKTHMSRICAEHVFLWLSSNQFIR
jgi:lysophospholipase L1-like esterase